MRMRSGQIHPIEFKLESSYQGNICFWDPFWSKFHFAYRLDLNELV